MPTQVKITEDDGVVEPTAPLGFGTYLGVATAILAGVGTVIAAIKANDVATAGAAAAGIVAVFKTLDGRYAQAVEKIGTAAATAGPWLEAALDVLDGDEVGPEADESVNPPLGATDPAELDPSKPTPPQPKPPAS